MTEQYSASELQQIFSNVCHELQSPLLGILGNLDLLKTTIKEAKEKAADSSCDDLIELLTEVDEYIHGIQLSTNHQITVTGKILSISKLDAGKVVLRQKLFCPHGTINDIVSVFKANLNPNQKIVIKLPDEELWVEGDETQLKQIIINLLNNAIKFTQQGTITLSLTCKTDSEESCYLFFTVQDSGIGMSESEQKNLFQRYSQANKFITEQFGGSGLGLAICKRLVELMGGTISVSSEKGVGTSFSFSVQLKALPKLKLRSPSRNVVRSTIANTKELPSLKPTNKAIFSGGDCGDLINDFDWSTNDLGSIEGWPLSLTSSVRLCLVSLFPMSIWWGPQHTLLYNDSYRTILGHKHPGAMGARGLKVWQEHASVTEPILKSILAGGDSVLFEDMLFHVARDAKFTEECYFDIAFSAMFDDEGNISGVLKVATETTQNVIRTRRMSLLSELSKASELNSIELVCQLIGEVLSKYANDTPFSMLYLLDDAQNLILRSCTGLLPNSSLSQSIITPKQRGAMPWSLEHVMDKQEVAVIENLPLEWELPGGIWPEPAQKAVVMPLTLSSTSQKLFGIIICGISPRRSFDDEYLNFINFVKVQVVAALDTAHRAEQLVDLDKAKTAFFTNISHEFRTPLALMLGPLSDSLDSKSSPLNQEQRERQLLIQRNSQRLLKLVNNLLEFSRLEAGRVDASYSLTDLPKLTKEICNTFSSVLKEANIDFILEMNKLDGIVYIDKDMWEKIILNLLSNAFKFTLQGQISVILESLEGKVCLSVRDTGVGIPEKELPRVFERFHRVENTHSRSFEGSGIGLALIQEFVKLHKGTISVKSTLNKGTCFTVTIPYGYAHLPADKVMKVIDNVASDIDKNTLPSVEASNVITAIIKESQPDIANYSVPYLVEPVQLIVDEIKQWQAPEVTFNRFQPSANTLRVLLVDDNVDMRSYIGNILKQFWEVELAVDGLQALESAVQNPPDLILTDIMMPKINGLELIKRLRNDSRTKGVPIILLSARAGDQAKVEGLDVGADDYIIKTSFSEKELLARVRNHLELGRLRRYLEKEVALRTEELIELNTALYEFIDMICHEVRNPLHGIVGNCELLTGAVTKLVDDFKSEITPPIDSLTTQVVDLKKYLSNIEECVNHQTTMLDEVILLTKLDAKKIEFVNIVCEPSNFLSGVMHNFKSKINSKGIKIVLNPVKEGSKIMTDPRCVNQILNGLLANVIENSAVGSEIAVSQSLKIEDNRLKLESNLVCTSVDIDEKTFSALINTFSQINVGVGQNYAKSRFSLAISNKLVGLMGGDKISITKEGTGETGFTFTVICQKAEELFSVINVPFQSAPVVNIAHPPYLPTKRALIVEDNHINQTLCKALLRKLGFDSEIANNGQEAVAMFKPSHFDFILMDVAMPIMDGIQATYEIRQIEANLKVGRPVVIIGLSAYSQEEKINKASEAGMNDYISKPATFNKIVNIISQWTKPNPLRKTKSELLLQNSIVPKSEAVALSMLSKPKIPSLL